MPLDQSRTQHFDVNHELLRFLQVVNEKIHSLELGSDLLTVKNRNSCKIFLVVGPVRSGTTYLLQQMMQSDYFFVPTNFLSRFYANLPFGAVLQRLLTDPELNFKGEMDDIIQLRANVAPSVGSDYGKTVGVFNAHTIWYFWKFKLGLQTLCTEIPENKKENFKKNFKLAINDIELSAQILGKKAACLKANFLSYNLELLQAFPNVVPVFVDRDTTNTIESYLRARKTIFGSEHARWGFYDRLTWDTKFEQPTEEIKQQISHSRKQFEDFSKNGALGRYIFIDFEELVSKTDDVKTLFTECLSCWDQQNKNVFLPNCTQSKSYVRL